MAEKDMNLFKEFAPVTTEEWKAKITADLKGRDYDRALVWKTNEGFNVQPYYRGEDLESMNHLEAKPGEFPYVRGNKKDNNDWLIRQDILVEDLKAANAKALDVMMKGINSLGFVFKSCMELTAADVATLLNDIALDAVEVNFDLCCNSCDMTTLFAAYVKEKGYDLTKVRASVNADPISGYVLTGKFCCEQEKAMACVKDCIATAEGFTQFTTYAVNGKNFNNAGSSISQELGYSLAMGAEYLTSLTEAGVSIEEAANKLRFNFAVGGNYFMELAKLRAGRMLWAKIVKAYGATDEACKMTVHSETSQWNKTVYDPYVNMLRTQTEAMSAVLGGTDSLTVVPFNAKFEATTEFSERIARNQQALLKDESHLGKIADPGAGSYYIETLTTSIAEQAWSIFLATQEEGGFIAALKAGSVQADINATAAKRQKAVATRRENVLGVNQFPNFTETISENLEASLFETEDRAVEGAEIETLKIFRGAQQIEALRYATDNSGKKPKAYMLTIGNLTMRKARAQFACNFFAVAGYEVVDNNGFETVEEGVAAAKAANADIVVICSSDDEYATLAIEANNAIGDDAIFVVAGAPACAEDLKAAGVENFINVKTNVLEALTAYNAKLGIN